MLFCVRSLHREETPEWRPLRVQAFFSWPALLPRPRNDNRLSPLVALRQVAATAKALWPGIADVARHSFAELAATIAAGLPRTTERKAMPGSLDSTGSSEILHMVTVAAERSDYHGQMHSTAGLTMMGRAATAAAASQLGLPAMVISTERVAFLAPVPVGNTVGFRSELEWLDEGRFRVTVEGLTRLRGASAGRCVMSGSFLLTAVDEEGRPLALPDRPRAAQVA